MSSSVVRTFTTTFANSGNYTLVAKAVDSFGAAGTDFVKIEVIGLAEPSNVTDVGAIGDAAAGAGAGGAGVGMDKISIKIPILLIVATLIVGLAATILAYTLYRR